MTKAFKAVLYGVGLMAVIFLVYLAYRHYKLEEKFNERIGVTITLGDEECDEFNVLWKVLHVDDQKFKHITGDNLYLVNDLDYPISEIDTVIVYGYLFVERRSDDYLGCRESLLFQNETAASSD